MNLRKKFRDLRDWCPQPPDRLPNRLKKYSVPIAAIATASIILSVSFFVFSLGLMSNMSVPVVPLVNVDSSANPTLLWNYTTVAEVSSSPVVVNGVVYIGSADQNVYAFNATTGGKLWNYFNDNYEFCTPAVANGMIYVGALYYVYALNATNGDIVWPSAPRLLALMEASPYVSFAFMSPTFEGGVVYCGINGCDGGGVSAFDAKTGNTLWASNFSLGVVYSSPTVANGVVYVSAEGAYPFDFGPTYGVLALDAKTGAQLWNYSTGYAAESSPAVAGGVVYAIFYDGSMYALNATNGQKLWNYTVGSPKVLAPFPNISSGNLDASPTVVDGVVYAASDNGNVYALNSKSGAKLWSCTTDNGTLSTPAVDDGILYVGSSDDNIYALNATTGAKLWNYATSGSVGSAVVVDGILYVGGGNDVYALRVSSPSAPSPASHPIWTWAIGIAVVVLIIAAVAVVLILKKKSTFGVKNGFA